ncbi:MAG: hypothetical protein KC978_25375, partial [Candidatus Omnitrophica bacterium]|nr:hypothetical protein [Candidatus Omnitrophota bacterium]
SLPDEIKREISDAPRRVSFDAAVQVARLSEPDHQSEIMKDVIAGAPVKEIRKRAKQLRDQNRPKKSRRAKTVEGFIDPVQTIETKTATITLQFKEENPTMESVRLALLEALRNYERP